MEPKETSPTIVGTVIESVWTELYETNRKEVLLATSFFFIAFILLIFTPTIAPAIQPHGRLFENALKTFINPKIVPVYSVDYVQGALERTYSALFVSSVVSFAGLTTRLFDIVRTQPIKWVMDIEED